MSFQFYIFCDFFKKQYHQWKVFHEIQKQKIKFLQEIYGDNSIKLTKLFKKTFELHKTIKFETVKILNKIS